MMRSRHLFTAAMLVAAIGLTAFQCSNDEVNEMEQLCGAYTQQRTISEDELELFESVIATIDTITEYTPVSVATQVVAGLNYKFLCRYDDRNGSTGDCYVVIYKPLKGDPELTGIEKL